MPFFATLSLRKRLASIAVVAFLGFSAMTTFVVFDVRETALESHRTRIQHIVESAVGVVAHFKGLEDAGTLTHEQAQEQAKAALRPLRFGADDYFFIYDFDGRRVMLGSDAKQEGQMVLGKTDTNGFKLFDRIVELGRSPGQGFLEYTFPRAGGGASVPKLAFVKTLPGWNWIVGTGVYIDDVDAIVEREAMHNILLSLAAMSVVVLFIFLISRSVIKQLGGEPSEVMDIMQRAKNGELNVEIDSAAPEGSVLGSLRAMLQGLSTLVRDIHRASAVLAGSAGEVAETSRQVSEAAQLQSDATSSMAAGVEEMTVAINHIADNAKATEKVSLQATELAAEGGKRAHSAVEAINSIATTVGLAGEQVGGLVRRANEIGSIAAVIKEIAAQTNLLALNAAIEAARAGDQGRGFAVVADEVRGLAERTSNATVQIEQMIQAIQQDTRQAVEVMETAVPQARQGVAFAEAASSSLREMLSGARVTLDHVREVANSTHEQGIASNSIAQQVEKIAQMVEETSQAVAQSADTAHSLTVLSETLNAALRRFKV